MNWLMSDSSGLWTRRAALALLGVLACAVVVPTDDVFWTAAVVTGLVGTAVATTALFHARSLPVLTRLVVTREAAPAVPLIEVGAVRLPGTRARERRLRR